MAEIINGILIPFVGTTLGAACVFFLKGTLKDTLRKAFNGFAAGVMVAASFFSLLLPSIEQSESLGAFCFFPAVLGLLAGFGFLLLLDIVIPPITEGCGGSNRPSMLFLAVTLHNIPEGMAVGVVLAGLAAENPQITSASALALSLGIAFQNFPEGAIISLPLRAQGKGRFKAFLWGALSGAAEPVAAVCTLLLAGLVVPLIPYFLSFAAGAMFYVVAEELLKENSHIGTAFFALGISLMTVISCAL